MSAVALAKLRGDSVEAIKEGVSECLQLINFEFRPSVQNIVVKPNLCYYWDYSTGETTDPRFVAATAELLREKISPGVRVTVVESDASAMRCKHVFKMLGYEKMARDWGIELVNLSEDENRPAEVTVAGQTFRFKMPKAIAEADLKINMPKIKYTIESLRITCALKNIFGCNPYPRKFRYHPRLEETIVALNKAMKFDLNLIDGNIVSGTSPRRLGLAMASTDPVAIDAAAACIAGINPRKIRYLKLASSEGIGSVEFVEKGEPLRHFAVAYPRKSLRRKLMGKAYNVAIRASLGRRLGLE